MNSYREYFNTQMVLLFVPNLCGMNTFMTTHAHTHILIMQNDNNAFFDVTQHFE